MIFLKKRKIKKTHLPIDIKKNVFIMPFQGGMYHENIFFFVLQFFLSKKENY